MLLIVFDAFRRFLFRAINWGWRHLSMEAHAWPIYEINCITFWQMFISVWQESSNWKATSAAFKFGANYIVNNIWYVIFIKVVSHFKSRLIALNLCSSQMADEMFKSIHTTCTYLMLIPIGHWIASNSIYFYLYIQLGCGRQYAVNAAIISINHFEKWFSMIFLALLYLISLHTSD